MCLASQIILSRQVCQGRSDLAWTGILLSALFLVVLERGAKWGGAHSVGMNSNLKGLESGATLSPLWQVWRDTSRNHADPGPGQRSHWAKLVLNQRQVAGGGKKILDKVEASQGTVIPYVLLLAWTVFLEPDIRVLAQLYVPLPSCWQECPFAPHTVSCHAPIILGAKDPIWPFPATFCTLWIASMWQPVPLCWLIEEAV